MAVPFSRVSTKRNEEEQFQKQALLNILQACYFTALEQLQLRLLKTNKLVCRRVTLDRKRYPNTAELDKHAQAETVRRFRSFSTLPTLSHNQNRTAVAVQSGLLHVSFPLSEPQWGEEPACAATSVALCKTLIQKENNVHKKHSTRTNAAGAQPGVNLKEGETNVSHRSPNHNPVKTKLTT